VQQLIYTPTQLEEARASTYIGQVIMEMSGSHDHGHAPFSRHHIRTDPGNTYVKFEVRSFNRFGAVRI